MTDIHFEDLAPGDVFEGHKVRVDPGEMLAYNRRNDPWPFHVDEAAAAASPFGGLTASGGYTITLMYRSLQGVYMAPGRTWAFLGGLEWKLRFPAPARPGDTLRARYEILSARPSSKPGRGVVETRSRMLDPDGGSVLDVDAVVLLATRPA